MNVARTWRAVLVFSLSLLPFPGFGQQSDASHSLKATAPSVSPSAISPAVTPAVTTNVTTTGGTSGQVPVFNSTSSVVNSNIYTTSFGIGINHGPGTGIAFDVLGKMVVRGIFDLGRTNDASTSAGASSNPLQFHAQVYNSSKSAYLNPFFELRAEPVGNNSATTSAKFNLLYSDGTAHESETGLSINGNGTINFASGQTFPSTANGITSVAHDSSFTGSGTSGSPLGLALVGHDSNLTGNGTTASPLGITSYPTIGGRLTANGGLSGISGYGDGVFGQNTSTNGTGVAGSEDESGGWGMYAFGESIGIYANSGSGGLAAEFAGNVEVTGSLSKGGGSFKIDDPIDPENKYLYHSFVESPDMMNIYNGNVVTDGSGTAVVTMPDWFEALNRDFRYQLTTIGQPAQAWIASKLANGSFSIRTDKPNVEVSWQITGIRQDAWANAHRIPVEEDKAESDKGHYLHPEAFGHLAANGIVEHHRALHMAHQDILQ